ncbi:MAG: DUF2100 domain-containing protein [Promethearchaeota archaeon]|nr:MAG: DUF2100 domain-containing protein [Candidatus Lokiarchaeota archaeon]
MKMKKLNSKEVNSLLAAIDDLIDIKVLIRKIVPTYKLDNSNYKTFHAKLASLYEKLQPIFSTYIKNETSVSKKTGHELKQLLSGLRNDNKHILISANSAKKKLKNLGFNPHNLIVSGGPIFFEDYKIINPNLSKNALEGIKKKCDRLLELLNNQNWQINDLILLYEKDNPTDSLILERLREIEKIIGKEIPTIELNSWNDLDTL